MRLATKYMTPVLLLSDSFLANSREPFRIPDPDTLPHLRVSLDVTAENFAPYRRDPQTLARPWVAPGRPGFEHRIGGLEKDDEHRDQQGRMRHGDYEDQEHRDQRSRGRHGDHDERNYRGRKREGFWGNIMDIFD